MARVNKLVLAAAILMASIVNFVNAGQANESNWRCVDEPHRPNFHFSPKENYADVPAVVYSGSLKSQDLTFNMYYQYQRNGTSGKGERFWGHAQASAQSYPVWEEKSIALSPVPNVGSIFGGSVIHDVLDVTKWRIPIDEDTVDIPIPIFAIYTTANETAITDQRIAISLSRDGGDTFTAFSTIARPGEAGENFRDPKVMVDPFFNPTDPNVPRRYLMLVASGNTVRFYHSADMQTWTGVGSWSPGNSDVIERPDLIHLGGDIYALIYSVKTGGPVGGSGTKYSIGSFTITGNSENYAFTPYENSRNLWLDHGPDNYGGATIAGFPALAYIGWLSNWAYGNETPNAENELRDVAFRGQMTLSRTLRLYPLNVATQKYRLAQTIDSPISHQELPSRGSFDVRAQTQIELTDHEISRGGFDNPLMDLSITLNMVNDPQFSICAQNGEEEPEETCFGYNGTHWFLDRSNSGDTAFHESFNDTLEAFALRESDPDDDGTPGNPVEIKIILDMSSIEVVADGGLVAMSALHFPTSPFNKIYINNWSKGSSRSSLRVINYELKGLHCWFSDYEATDAGSSITVSFAVITFVTAIYAIRNLL